MTPTTVAAITVCMFLCPPINLKDNVIRIHSCTFVAMVRDGWVDCCSVFRDFCGLFSGNEMGSEDVGLLHRHG